MDGTAALVIGLVRAVRPRQWIKNLLVYAAPLAAGTIFTPAVFKDASLALLVFIFASASTYLINDVLDVESDRQHPYKKNRAIASGIVPVPLALGLGLALALSSVTVPLILGNTDLALVVGCYLVLQAGYVLWAKHQPVYDLAVVTAGFVLRAAAGGVATGLYLSPWFLTVTASVSMFVIAGKRYSELVQYGANGSRRSLAAYSPEYLKLIWSVSLGVAITFYTLWAADIVARGGGWAARASVIPFCLILLRYARDIDGAGAESPERIVLGDRSLQVLAAIWAGLFLIEVFVL